jgi:hypothetical protein
MSKTRTIELSEPIKSHRGMKLDILKEAGIDPREASDFERLSDVPRDEFEAALATKSVRDLIDKPSPVVSMPRAMLPR